MNKHKKSIMMSKYKLTLMDTYYNIEDRLKQLDYDIKKRKLQLKNLDYLIKEKRETYDELSLKLKRKIDTSNRVVSRKSFDILNEYITGKLKYVVNCGEELTITRIEDMEDDIYGKINHISLFGGNNEELSFGAIQYSDGNGGYTEIYIYKTLNEALHKCEHVLNRRIKLSSSDYDLITKYKLKVNKPLITAYETIALNQIDKDIKQYNKEISELATRRDNIYNRIKKYL